MNSNQGGTWSSFSPIRIRICFLPKSLPNTLERVSPILARGGKKSETGLELHSWATVWWRLQKVWCGRPAPSSQRRPFSKVSSEAMQTPCRIYWNLKPMAASSQDRFGFGSPGLCCLIQDILPSETDGFQDKCWYREWSHWYYSRYSFNSSPSFSAVVWPGLQFSNMLASPYWSRIKTLLTRWLNFSPSSCPVSRARAGLSLWSCSRFTLCHPPSDSSTTGMKAIPCSLHVSSCHHTLVFKGTVIACPGVEAALDIPSMYKQ